LEKGRGPSAARRNDLEKIYGPIKDNQFYDYAKVRGQALKEALIKDAPRIKGMKEEQFAEYIERISRRINPMAARTVGLKRPSRSDLIQQGVEP
jgi:hypothetical protein